MVIFCRVCRPCVLDGRHRNLLKNIEMPTMPTMPTILRVCACAFFIE